METEAFAKISFRIFSLVFSLVFRVVQGSRLKALIIGDLIEN